MYQKSGESGYNDQHYSPLIETTLLENIVPDSIHELGKIINRKVLDVADVFRHLNPFVPLAQFGEEDKKEELYEKASARNEELLSLGEDNPILYLEYSYVKEEFRRNGIFTLNLDVLKMIFKDTIIWLNMEPLDESELDSIDQPKLTTEEYQQITLNNLIAEKTGFTVDNDLWKIEVKDNIKQVTKKMKARKCAYLIPEIYQNIIKNDEDLVEQGRIRQHLKQENQEMKNTNEPKLTKTYDADINLDDFTFIDEDTELDFSDYLILNFDDSFCSDNPIPMSSAAITELVLLNQSMHKKYYFTLLCDDCIHNLYITDKPFKGTLCAIMDSENQDLLIDIVENKPVLLDPDSDENLQETENEGLLPAVKTIVYLSGLSEEEFKEVIKEGKGMKVSDFLTEYHL